MAKKIDDAVLDELLRGCERPEDLMADGGLMKVSTAAEEPATGRRKTLPPWGRVTDAGIGTRLGTRAPRIAGVCQGALA